MSVKFMAGIIQGLQASHDRAMAISAARDKKRQDDEIFEMKKKKFEQDIKIKEAEGTLNDIEAEFERIRLKKVKEIYEADSLLKDKQISQAGALEKDRAETFKRTGARIMSQMMPSSSQYEPDPLSPNLVRRVKKPSESEQFTQGFKQAEAGKISFDDLGKKFPTKRADIKKKRILSLPEKSQRLLTQISEGIKADAVESRKAVDEKGNPAPYRSDPEGVIADYLIDLVENKEKAKSAGHDVDGILDILGVTESEILDAFPEGEEPKKNFLDKIKNLIPIFAIPQIIGNRQKLRNLQENR